MNKKILSLLQYLFFFGLGVFLVWWSVKKISEDEWVNIKNAFLNARYWLIFPVITCMLLSHYSRAMRWRILMEPLGYKPRVFNTYMAVLIGYFANLAFPRLGEVLKCTVLARYEKVPADKLVGTIIAERAFDVLCLVVVVIITVLTQVDVIGSFISQLLGSAVHSKTSGFTFNKLLVLAGILGAVFLLLVFVFRVFAHVNFIQKMKKVFISIWKGITSIRYVQHKGWFIFHTVFIWCMYLMGILLGMYALKETSAYGINESLSVLTTGSFAMIVPTPGQGFGVYPYFVMKTMLLYNLEESLGFAFGWLMWSVQFFIILLGGFVALLLIPYYNKKRTDEKSGHH